MWLLYEPTFGENCRLHYQIENNQQAKDKVCSD
jgi:hypothetical protein